jgi:hypothetical protein
VGLGADPVAGRVRDGGVVLGVGHGTSAALKNQWGAATAVLKLETGGSKKIVHIIEEKVFAALGDAAEETCRWVLDTGASNHMSGCGHGKIR